MVHGAGPWTMVHGKIDDGLQTKILEKKKAMADNQWPTIDGRCLGTENMF